MHSVQALLPIFFLWTLDCLALNDSANVAARSSTDGTMPKAVVISPSEYFEGNDGPWSSFNIRVGTPEQDVRVLVSTASPESMVVLSNYGCTTSVFEAVPPNCAVARGVLFNSNDSSTWNELGTFGINQDGVGLEANLGYSERANFGLDTLGIGLTGPSLGNQTIAGIVAAEPFYLGIFGLNNEPVNLTSLGNFSSSSFITTLKDKGVIPSLSWSYTAGAQYRLKQVYGQLIFSGYDTSRFTENSVSFSMADDITRDLVVVLQSISYSGSSTETLLSDPIDIFIDSTDPNFWLPNSVCDAFEKAFGLTLDSSTGLYLVNETHHNTLLDSDAEVTFRLSDVASGGATVAIVLPYSAFDLTAEQPLVHNTSYYFPLKRANSSTQYTLGRAFLQEAYLSADYERRVFNVSACAWVQGAVENIVTITSKNSDSTTNNGGSTSSSSSPLGGGAIAGIVLGCVAIVAIIVGAVVFVVLRRRKARSYSSWTPEPSDDVLNGPVFNFSTEPKLPSQESPARTIGDTIAEEHGLELDGQDTHIRPSTELDSNDQQIYQLHGQSRPRVADGPVYHELPASEVARPPNLNGTSVEGAATSHDGPEDEGEPSSPYVSTLGSTGPHSESGDSQANIVSPTTPIHHLRHPFGTEQEFHDL